MESSGLCLQYFIGMGNFPQNCQWMKLEIGNFEKIVLENRFISLASYGKSKMFVDGHLEHKCSFPKRVKVIYGFHGFHGLVVNL
jgi:hypothetical protein